NDNPRGFQPLDFLKRDLVVSKDAQLFAELAEVLHEVVGKRIVVIDNENHNSNVGPTGRATLGTPPLLRLRPIGHALRTASLIGISAGPPTIIRIRAAQD